MTRILITGASGFIGSHLASEAVSRGHQVHSLIRRKQGITSYPAGEIFYGLLPYDIPLRALEGVDTIIHCAVAATATREREAEAVNVEGTRFLLKLARRAGMKKFVFLSSQSAMGKGSSAYARTKREGEKLVRESGLAYTIIRPGLVYGPPPNGMFGRMCQTVKRLPALPLLDGGRAPVQPVHVDDLIEALLACSEPGKHDGETHGLGHPDGVPLRKFLGYVSKGIRRRKPFSINVPVTPIDAVLRVTEKIGIPLPVTRSNLEGMRSVRMMDTLGSMKAFSLPERSLAFDVARAAGAEPGPPAQRPVRFLLVGAGKIAMAHALSLVHTEGCTLAGVVDRSSRARSLFRSMGFDVPFYDDMEVALQEAEPEAAVLATPTYTHYSLTRMCLERGISVLVEKPMAATREGLTAFQALTSRNSNVACAVGYQAAQCPHIASLRGMLSSGELGELRSIRAHCFQTHIMQAMPGMWELDKVKSGGGVIINFAGHLLSMMNELFGRPDSVSGSLSSLYFADIEDAAELEFRYGAISAPVLASWSMPGFPQAEYRIYVETDRAKLAISNTGYTMVRGNGERVTRTERDYSVRGPRLAAERGAGLDPVGYNPAPDMSGAGFAVEHRSLARAVRARADRPYMNPDHAAETEETIHRIYDQCEFTNDPGALERILNRVRAPDWRLA